MVIVGFRSKEVAGFLDLIKIGYACGNKNSSTTLPPWKTKFHFSNTVLATFEIFGGEHPTRCLKEPNEYLDGAIEALAWELALTKKTLSNDERRKLIGIVHAITKRAYLSGSGCSIIIDLSDHPLPIAGDNFVDSLSLLNAEGINIACRLAQIDGSIQIDRKGNLLRFGCLLDGLTTDTEDRSRGARFNSAVRFTAVNRDAIAFVVSSDGPLTCVVDGRQVRSHQADCTIRLRHEIAGDLS